MNFIDLSQTFLNTGTTNETFQQSGKQALYKHILTSSASLYKSSGLWLFRTTTAIQWGSDAFDKSRLVMTFLTILKVTEILCIFRLVPEGKAGKEIPEFSILEFLGRFLRNNFALSDAEDKTSMSLNRRSIANLPLLRTLLPFPQKS